MLLARSARFESICFIVPAEYSTWWRVAPPSSTNCAGCSSKVGVTFPGKATSTEESRYASQANRQKRRTCALNTSGCSKLLRWAAFRINFSSASGIAALDDNVTRKNAD